MAEDFSVAIIAKNGEKTLPRLLKSLRGVDDVVLVDTGSTDKTVRMAKAAGCSVSEVGDRFKNEATKDDVGRWKRLFGYEPSFKAGEKYFHFGNARNHAASLTKNDWVFQPDVDEEVKWDLGKIREAIQGANHLCYRFCYQHNEDGSCALELQQSKFYRKSKLRWNKWVHEVLLAIPGQDPGPPKWCGDIFHHHWQEKKEERGSQYLAGLELSVLESPEDDRNVYYLAREYFYNSKFDRAIELFDKAIRLGKWPPEKNQAYVYQGLSYKAKGSREKAIECFHRAMIAFDERREPFWELATLYEERKDLDRALVYLQAAMAIPFKPQGYLSNKDLYGWKIPDKIAYIYNIFRNVDESKRYWLEALKHEPPGVILGNGIKWFYGGLPLISIVIPTIRVAGYERLMRSIIQNTAYPRYEIIKKGGEGTAVEKFNQGVEEASGEFIAYIADDCEVGNGWLTQAFSHFKENFRDRGLVIFNDDYWEDRSAHHFLCSKNIKEELDGHIWNPSYHHLGADNELYGRLKNKDLIEYCQYARIKHHHYLSPSRGLSKEVDSTITERIEKNREADKKTLEEKAKEFGFKTLYLKEGEIELGEKPGIREFTAMIKRGENFSYVKLGDAEVQCVGGVVGENLDGQPYSKELAAALADSYNFLHTLPNAHVNRFDHMIPGLECPVITRGNMVGDEFIHKNTSPEKFDFYKALKLSPRKKVFIGPKHLREAQSFLNTSQMIEIPEKNCFTYNFDIEPEENAIYLFCSGLASKVWIAKLLKKSQNITCIDLGSALDPIFGPPTRTDQVGKDALRKHYKELL